MQAASWWCRASAFAASSDSDRGALAICTATFGLQSFLVRRLGEKPAEVKIPAFTDCFVPILNVQVAAQDRSGNQITPLAGLPQ